MNPHSYDNEWACFWGCAGALVGAVVGALALSAVVDLWHVLNDPAARKDGQYGLFFLYTLPAGAVLGSVVGFIVPYGLYARRRNRNR